MLSGWLRSFAVAVTLADGSDVKPTFPRDASASARVRSGGAHLGHPGAVHANGQRGLIGPRVRRTHRRGREGGTGPLTLRCCTDRSEAMTLVKALHHETNPFRRDMPHGVPGKQKSRRRSSLRT